MRQSPEATQKALEDMQEAAQHDLEDAQTKLAEQKRAVRDLQAALDASGSC